MRLKISFHKKNCCLPLNYQHMLQGLIYQSLPKEEEGRFYHDEGYRTGAKKYKMFVFSNLIGRNHTNISKRTIMFEEFFCFFIGSEDENLIQCLYQFFNNNKMISLGKELIDVIGTDLISNPYFKGIREYTVKTISPLTAYRTADNYVTYYSPSSDKFEQLVTENLTNKVDSLNLQNDIHFKLLEVLSEKKRIIHYKKTFYEAYTALMRIEVNCQTLSLLLNTGISAKGSAGFGMIEIVNEKDILSV